MLEQYIIRSNISSQSAPIWVVAKKGDARGKKK